MISLHFHFIFFIFSQKAIPSPLVITSRAHRLFRRRVLNGELLEE